MKPSKSSKPNSCNQKIVTRFFVTPKTRCGLGCTWASALACETNLDSGETISLFTTRRGTKDPEGCSSVILNRLWESVRGDADPELVHQLDCQFQLAQTIHVSLKGFHQLTTREMIRRLQSQIDSQLPTLAASGVPSCQSSLTLDVAGKPNMGCFVVAPHRKEERKYWDDLTLDHALAVLGTRNLFRTVHYPPKITLDFLRNCQFSKPFPY